MARNVKEKNKIEVTASFYIVLFTLFVAVLIGFLVWLLGIDLGFMQIGSNKLSAEMFLVVLALMLGLEYYQDVRYAKVLNKYSNKSNSFRDYIPFYNSCQSLSKVQNLICMAIIAVFVVCVLFVATPLMRILPISFVASNMRYLIYVAGVMILVLVIIRGIEHIQNRRNISADYKELSGEYGQGSKFINIINNASYFIPVFRLNKIREDIQFIKTTFNLVVEDAELE